MLFRSIVCKSIFRTPSFVAGIIVEGTLSGFSWRYSVVSFSPWKSLADEDTGESESVMALMVSEVLEGEMGDGAASLLKESRTRVSVNSKSPRSVLCKPVAGGKVLVGTGTRPKSLGWK